MDNFDLIGIYMSLFVLQKDIVRIDFNETKAIKDQCETIA